MTASHDEDPTAQAAAKLGQAVAVLAAAAEAFAQLQATRTSERAGRDERTAAAARTQLRARHSADRLAWSPLLDADGLSRLDVPDTLAGWGAARCWPQDPEAHAARRAAEQRLTDLRPEVMRAYTDQVAAGVQQAAAMRDAGWLPDQEPATATAEPAADRPALSDGVLDLAAGTDLGEDGGRGEPTAGVDRSRTIEGEVLASRVHPPDELHFPGQLLVEAGAVTAVLAEQGLDQARHTALPVAAAVGRT
jgi:hypothetical protein